MVRLDWINIFTSLQQALKERQDAGGDCIYRINICNYCSTNVNLFIYVTLTVKHVRRVLSCQEILSVEVFQLVLCYHN